MNDNDEKMKKELEEFNEEVEKYNEMISENEEQVEEIDEEELEEEKEETKQEENKLEESSASIEVKKTNKSKISIIGLTIVIILLVVLTSIIGINKLKKSSNQFLKSTDDYSEEEKNIAGISEKTKEQDSTKNIIKEVEKQEEEKKNNINNSDNYEKYQKLSEEEKKKTEVIPEKESKSIELIDDIKEEIDILNNLPSKYNLKDHIKLTVDDQNSYGLCWDFATLESMETYYQIKNKKEIDLSEISVDYLTSRKLFGYREPHDGGNFSYVVGEGSIKGVKKEGKNEYRDWNENEIWSLLETEDNYYITDYVDFPSIYKTNGKADVSDEELQEFRKLVKSHIMQNGSLYAVLDGRMGSDKHSYRSENTWPSHAVSIVGWDDTYPKEKFTDLSHPEKNNHPIHDGAYIIKNSWGTDFGEKGYYYISYDDQLIESELRGVLSLNTNKKHYLKELPNYLKEYIQKNDSYQIKRDKKGEYVFPSELKTISFLNIKDNDQINNEEFSKIINMLPQLSNIIINNNNITDISSLTKLNNLVTLHIDNGGAIQDYSVIGQIKSLKSLTLSNSNLSDISFISNLEKLSYLDLTNNHISDISALANLKLDSIILDSNNITDVSVLMNKDQLHYLSLNKNPGVVGYSEFPNLYYLSVSNCELSEIEPFHVKGNFGISLSISNNHLTQLPYIENNTPKDPDEPLYYYSIDAENNNIDSLSGLNKENVYYLNLAGNNFSDLSKLEDYFVNSINLSNNNLKDTSTFNNQNIKAMNLSNNKEIVISKELNSLNSIELDNCNIKSLKDIVMLNKLESISLNGNEIASLEGINKLSHLACLSLNNNQISSLDDIQNSSISQLYLENNKIENLSGIENMEELYMLSLSNNPIKEIESLSKLKKLNYLYLDNIGTIDATKLSSSNDKLSISLQNNEIEGTMKSNWNVVNLSGSTLKEVDLNNIKSHYLNIENTKGTVKYDKLISNIIKRENDNYISITFNKNPISLDDIYEIDQKKIQLSIRGGTILEKENLKDNQYSINDMRLRKLLIKSYTSSEIMNGYWNDNFTSIIPNNSEKDIILNLFYRTEGDSFITAELTITNDKK